MPIEYDPKDAVMCWPAGDYDAELIKVEDKTSKIKPDGSGGNPMQVLTWRVFNNDGQTMQITDYVVFPAALFKIKQLAIALGKKDEFEDRTFQADDQIGCNVIAELAVEEQDGFDDKNKIRKVKAPKRSGDMASAAESNARAKKPVSNPISDEPEFTPDEVPF